MQQKTINGLSLFKKNEVQITGVQTLKYIPTKEAVELYTKYHNDLNGTHDIKTQSYINIDKLLKLGYTYKELLSAVEEYRKSIKGISTGKRSKYIYACQNFFSPQQFKFTAYLKDANIADIPNTNSTTELPTSEVILEEI